MKLKEVSEIEKCTNEDKLIKILEEIGDKVIFRGYQEEQVILLADKLIKLDILSMEYETREEILSVLCDMVSYYDILSKIDRDSILNLEDRLESDLKEYVTDFFHVLLNNGISISIIETFRSYERRRK